MNILIEILILYVFFLFVRFVCFFSRFLFLFSCTMCSFVRILPVQIFEISKRARNILLYDDTATIFVGLRVMMTRNFHIIAGPETSLGKADRIYDIQIDDEGRVSLEKNHE